jgi:hypothetical protein
MRICIFWKLVIEFYFVEFVAFVVFGFPPKVAGGGARYDVIHLLIEMKMILVFLL